MMLVTVAFDPANWLAIEPQKFSAATTGNPEPFAAPPPPQPAIVRATSATAPARIIGRWTVIRLLLEVSCSACVAALSRFDLI
jgi:hypothetical protein